MNAKILKYEMFTLFTLAVITMVVFYYRDTLPDNYLSISSASTHGFFAYYGTSLINLINYYSGPWVLVPCTLFTSFYVFIFSKRADWIDVLNVFSLSLFSLWTVYYLYPTLLGSGLFQILTTNFSPFASFLVWLGSLVAFTWGTFRGGFTERVGIIVAEIKKIDLKTPAEKIQAFTEKYFTLIKNKISPEQKLAKIELEEALGDSFASNQTASSENIIIENKIVNILPVRIPSTEILRVENNDEVEDVEDEGLRLSNKLEKKMITLEAHESEMGEELSDNDDEDDDYVDESEIGLSLKTELRESKYNDDKYYDLVKVAAHKKGEQKFSQPDDKYFLDIINKIQVKLGEFKIQGRIINVLKGPVVDTFEWELGAGEKVSRLTVTAEDLSLALSGSPIRMVYPMKGRTTVGIEVPRNPRDFIFLDEIISSKDYSQTAHQLPLAMGKDAFGEPVVVDLASMPHMLVAGSTGAGKSVFINAIIVSLLIKKSPNQMKLILIDPKQLELALYARLPHLLMPVITEAKTAATSLLWACQEMERRYSIMSEFGVRNIEGFNHKLKRAPRELVDKIRKFYEYSSEDTYELPYIVIIVDEFADLILTQKGKDIETHICRLAAKARAAGVHLILATQRPSVDVITGLIKSNFPTRVSFRVTSSTDSRTILNAMGAEKLLGKGDMLYKQGVDTTRIHSAYVEEDEIESLTDKLAEMAPSFNPNIMEFLENGGEEEPEVSLVTRDGSESGDRDDKYDEAVRVVIEHRSASASLLQRRLGVGYNRAANLIEEMEAKGVVGPAQGSKPRKVLMGSESLT